MQLPKRRRGVVIALVAVGTLAVLPALALFPPSFVPREELAAAVRRLASSAPAGKAISQNLVAPSPSPATTPASTPTTTTAEVKRIAAVVERVVDGDTIIVRLPDGRRERVRLLGIDTPESVDPRRPVECFGKEAAARTRKLLAGRHVLLEFDPTQGLRDRYGRLLAYVFRDDGLFINETLIAEGFAHEYTYKVPHRYRERFRKAQQAAKAAKRGLWHPSACAGSLKQHTYGKR